WSSTSGTAALEKKKANSDDEDCASKGGTIGEVFRQTYFEDNRILESVSRYSVDPFSESKLSTKTLPIPSCLFIQ
uniref:Uncharacterized protein n=1 Tax=Parascaris univalens TaxID=6257 RepID=A0A915BSX6_PARUN